MQLETSQCKNQFAEPGKQVSAGKGEKQDENKNFKSAFTCQSNLQMVLLLCIEIIEYNIYESWIIFEGNGRNL